MYYKPILKKKDSNSCYTWIYIFEFDNAIRFITLKHQSISIFWYLENFLEKNKTSVPLQINIS